MSTKEQELRIEPTIEPEENDPVDELAERLGLSSDEAAELSGIPAPSNVPLGSVAARTAEQRLNDINAIFDIIEPWAGNTERALAWYTTERIPGLGALTAEGLVKAGKAAAVRSYLDRIAVGGYA